MDILIRPSRPDQIELGKASGGVVAGGARKNIYIGAA
jgi:hypothetical protein